MNNIFENSFLVKRFFVSDGFDLTESGLLKFLRFEGENLSYFFGFLAILINWYEGLLVKLLPQSLLNVLPVGLLVLAVILGLKRVRIYALHFWFLGFIAVALVSGMFSVVRGDGNWNVVLYIVLLGQFLLAMLWSQAQNANRLTRGLLLAGLPLAVYGIWQFASGSVVYSTSSIEALSGRANAFFSSPNVFGMLMTLLLLATVWILTTKTKKIVYIPVAIIFAAALFVSLSRTAWIAFLIGVIPLFGFSLKKLSFAGFFSPVTSRVAALLNPEYWFNASIDGRIWAINNGLYILRKFPLIGTGPGTYGGKFAQAYSSPVYFYGMQKGYHALLTTDNQFISLLVQFGILGFLSFSGFLISVWAQVSKNKNAYAQLGKATFLAFILMMFFSNALEFTAIAVPAAFLIGASLTSEVK